MKFGIYRNHEGWLVLAFKLPRMKHGIFLRLRNMRPL